MAIALNHGFDGSQWYVSPRNLQMVCLGLCVVYRNHSMSQIIVTLGTPSRLWLRHKQQAFMMKHRASRVPALRARSITWMLPPESVPVGSRVFHDQRGLRGSGLWRLLRSRIRNKASSTDWWPESLRNMTFGPSFNYPVNDIVWPASLTRLTFGRCFDKPIQGVVWPDQLEHLTFGTFFNQAIQGVAWPASLTHLTFGITFDKPIDAVVWPNSLQCLTYDTCFNQPISGMLSGCPMAILANMSKAWATTCTAEACTHSGNEWLPIPR